MVIVRTIFASVLKHVQYSLLPKMILFALSDDVFVSFSSLEYEFWESRDLSSNGSPVPQTGPGSVNIYWQVATRGNYIIAYIDSAKVR